MKRLLANMTGANMAVFSKKLEAAGYQEDAPSPLRNHYHKHVGRNMRFITLAFDLGAILFYTISPDKH